MWVVDFDEGLVVHRVDSEVRAVPYPRFEMRFSPQLKRTLSIRGHVHSCARKCVAAHLRGVVLRQETRDTRPQSTSPKWMNVHKGLK